MRRSWPWLKFAFPPGRTDLVAVTGCNRPRCPDCFTRLWVRYDLLSDYPGTVLHRVAVWPLVLSAFPATTPVTPGVRR